MSIHLKKNLQLNCSGSDKPVEQGNPQRFEKFELYQEIRRNAGMCDALRELMEEDLGEREFKAKFLEDIFMVRRVMGMPIRTSPSL